MAGGIWEALGAALQSGSNTYRDASAQQLAQRKAEEQLKLQQAEAARQAEYQQQQMGIQRDQLAMDKKQFELGQEDRQRKILESAIEHADPNSVVDNQLLDSVRATAPDMLSRFNVTAPKFGVNATTGLGKATSDNPLGLATPGAQPAVSFTPEQATRRATLPEQAQIQALDTQKQNTQRAQQIMDALASGKLKDTPANRALISQYTSANPNEMWGSIEHPSRANGGGGRGGPVDGLAAAVLANPALYSQLTPTQKGALAPALAQAGFDFTKPMGASGIKEVAAAQAAIGSAKELEETLRTDDGKSTGPIQGLAGWLPDLDIAQSVFGTRDVKKMQALIDQTKQTIGKLFEGGVLRKEDEVKYAKILPTVYDSVEVQLAKMHNVREKLDRDLASYTNQQNIAGNRTQAKEPNFPMQPAFVGQQTGQQPPQAPNKSRFQIVNVTEGK
jgi:hypothetical protein